MYSCFINSSSQAVVVHAFIPSTREAQLGGSLLVWGQGETLFQKENK